MGAALKMDPTRIRVTEFWKVEGDPLARALRKRFKHNGCFPEKKFLCVYSDELLANHPMADTIADDPSPFNKPQTNGSLVHITAVFGFTLAGLVLQDAR
jgi:tRNA A37 threonylcarbamoyladenosine dehydratase